MKKIVLLFVLLSALVGSSAMAFEVAPVVGVNFSNVSVSGATGAISNVTWSSKMGIDYGVPASFSMAPLISLQVGALVDNRKFLGTDASDPLGKIEVETKQNYIQIPVVARFTVFPGLSLGAGGYYAMGTGDIKAKTTITVPGVDPVVEEETSTWEADKTKKTDLGLIASVAYNIPIAPLVSFMIDGRYLLGLTNFQDDPALPNTTSKWKSIQLLAGVNIGF